MADTLHKSIVIVGAGPAGIGAALRLHRAGFTDLVILDRFDLAGGIPRKYGRHAQPSFVLYTRGKIVHGCEFADRLAARLASSNIDFRPNATVTEISAADKTVRVASSQGGTMR